MSLYRKQFAFLVAIGLIVLGIVMAATNLPNSGRQDLGLKGLSVVHAEDRVFAPMQQKENISINPGYYCQSAYSNTARTLCSQAGGKGMHARWFWCQLVSPQQVYDFSVLENWVVANHQAGLRSHIGFKTKDLRTDSSGLAGIGSCTATSGGSPSWVLATNPFNNDINGVPSPPLENPAGYPHLNYLDTQTKAAIQVYIQHIDEWLVDFSIRNPSAYASIEGIETMFGEQDTGAGHSNSWYPWADRQMYRCRYGGGTWTPDATGSAASTCSLPSPSVNWAAAANWRDNYSKPMLDHWANVAPDKVRFMVISNNLASADIEMSQACQGCGGKNLIDYAFDNYGIGSVSTGGAVDAFNGSGPDRPGKEYTNWWNVFKMRWRDRIVYLEAGASGGYNGGSPGCCDTSKEIYWNALKSIDYGAKYITVLATDLYNNRLSGALVSARKYRAETVESPDWRFSKAIGIWFRDTDGTYYPDGDNGSSSIPNAPRGEYPCCHHNPNYEWLLYQDNWHVSQVVRANVLPPDDRSLWARRTTATYPVFKFTIDPDWYPATTENCVQFRVRVVYLDSGTDSWAFVYPPLSGPPTGLAFSKTNTNKWNTESIFVSDWDMRRMISDGQSLSSFYIQDNGDGIDTFHMVYIEDAGNCVVNPPPTPTPEPPLPICTVTPIPTRVIEVINTPTPTPTKPD